MGDGLDRVVEAVAVLAAVAKNLVALQTADRVLDPRADTATLLVVGFLAGQQRPTGSFAVRDDQAGVDDLTPTPSRSMAHKFLTCFCM